MKAFNKRGGAGPFDLSNEQASVFKGRVSGEVQFPSDLRVGVIEQLDTPQRGMTRVSVEPSYADFGAGKRWAPDDVSIPDDLKARIANIYAEVCAA